MMKDVCGGKVYGKGRFSGLLAAIQDSAFLPFKAVPFCHPRQCILAIQGSAFFVNKALSLCHRGAQIARSCSHQLTT
jgi:hypothetical protein